MAERRNGRIYRGSKLGSSERGVFAAPASWSYIDSSHEQARLDKQSLIERLRKKHEHQSTLDLGNKELPAYKKKDEFITTVENNKVTLFEGATGSGKSTQAPQYLLEAGYDKVYVLVPRRIIADNLYDRIKSELSSQLPEGDTARIVGVVHGERSEFAEDNVITIMTPNTYVRMEADIREKYADKKVALFADEIHEANIYTELATGIAAIQTAKNDNWRLIASSATHNRPAIERALSPLNEGGQLAVVSVEGRPYALEQHEIPEKNPMELYAEVGHDHKKSIIFTSGKKEIDKIIEETRRELEKHATGSSQKVLFRKLHAELSEVEMRRINDPVPEGHRLVIVSTPAGNSGITIPGTTMVISDGTINREVLNSDGVPGLVRKYLSRDELVQQFGRAGRDVDGGSVYLAKPVLIVKSNDDTLLAEHLEFLSFDKREHHAPPEILNTNLSRVVLSTAGIDYDFHDVNNFIPNSVTKSSIIEAEESLFRLGALDEDNKITKRGRDMDRFALRPELSRSLVEAWKGEYSQQNLARVAMIAVALEVGGLQDFSDKHSKRWQQLLRPTTSDDLLVQLDLFQATLGKATDENSDFNWLNEHDIHYKRTYNAHRLYRKIMKTLKIYPRNLDIPVSLPDEEQELRDVFTAGMIDKVYKKSGTSNRTTIFRNIHNTESGTARRISDRSIMSSKSTYVAGFPRWYISAGRAGEQLNEIVEMVFPVDPKILGHYALRERLLQSRPLDPRIEKGSIVEYRQPTFGSIDVGQPEAISVPTPKEHSEAAKQLLFNTVVAHPGAAQRALLEIADQLVTIANTLPFDEFEKYLTVKHEDILTREKITDLLMAYSAQEASVGGVDQRLREYIYKHGISIYRYIPQQGLDELMRRSPSTMVLFGHEARVFYSEGRPYVTNIPTDIMTQIDQKIFLEDGREVRIQIANPNSDRGTRRVSGAKIQSSVQ